MEVKAVPQFIFANQANPDWLNFNGLLVEKALQTPNCEVVFLGDSITQAWFDTGKSVQQQVLGKFNPVNLGINADTTENLLWRITEGGNWTANLNPKKIVILIGTNNFGNNGDDVTKVKLGIDEILKVLKQKSPTSEIILMALFQRSFPQGIMNVIKEYNCYLQQIAEKDKQIIYLNINKDLGLGDEAATPLEIFPDGLHLSSQGYKIWADSLLTII